MIELVKNLPWTPYGIQCPDEVTAHKVHQFLRQAILDRHICISKIIGFSIESNNTFRASTGEYISRHEQIGESYAELMVKLSDKIFLNVNQKYFDMVLTTGMNDVVSNRFTSVENSSEAEVLYVKSEVCRCLKKETILRVALLYDSGYKHMSVTCKNLESNFFPCNVDFNLAPFYRIIPMMSGDTLVKIRYYNGATEAQFRDILTKWGIYIKSGNIKLEEKLWLQSFGH